MRVSDLSLSDMGTRTRVVSHEKKRRWRLLADPLVRPLLMEPLTMSADPIALRVVRRHQAALPPAVPTTTFRVDFDFGGWISWIGLKMALESKIGYLKKLRFRPSLGSPTTTVAWEGVKPDGEVVTGKLVLRMTVTETEVATWGEVTVDLGMRGARS